MLTVYPTTGPVPAFTVQIIVCGIVLMFCLAELVMLAALLFRAVRDVFRKLRTRKARRRGFEVLPPAHKNDER
jgi:hypothetical protein